MAEAEYILHFGMAKSNSRPELNWNVAEPEASSSCKKAHKYIWVEAVL